MLLEKTIISISYIVCRISYVFKNAEVRMTKKEDPSVISNTHDTIFSYPVH